MGFQIQVRGEWSGAVGGWRPAVSGTYNQTGSSDEDASTFARIDDAQATLDHIQTTELPEGEDVRDNAPQFRIVEV